MTRGNNAGRAEASVISRTARITYFEQPGNPGQIGTYPITVGQLA